MGHTLGPWKAHNYNNNEYIDIDGDGIRICSIPLDTSGICFDESNPADTPEKEVQERWANARLIAAAPELLEELEHLVNAAGGYSSADKCEAIKRARALITKAKGELEEAQNG